MSKSLQKRECPNLFAFLSYRICLLSDRSRVLLEQEESSIQPMPLVETMVLPYPMSEALCSRVIRPDPSDCTSRPKSPDLPNLFGGRFRFSLLPFSDPCKR